jgi:hypothetical protein
MRVQSKDCEERSEKRREKGGIFAGAKYTRR